MPAKRKAVHNAKGEIAFPLGELRLTVYLTIAACLGGTLWALDAPERVWPWFPVAFAALGAILLVFVAYETAASQVAQALTGLLVAGGMFYYAGERFLALEYSTLRWLCWSITGIHALNSVVRIFRSAASDRTRN